MPPRLDTGGLAHTAIILGRLCGSVVSAEPGLPFPARAYTQADLIPLSTDPPQRSGSLIEALCSRFQSLSPDSPLSVCSPPPGPFQ